MIGDDANKRSRTILAIGGAGYVGSHCCKSFADRGWEVVVFDNLSRGWADFVHWGPLIEGDILDQAALAAAMSAVQPDVVAHFAAFAYVGESVENPALYYRNNVVGTLNVLDSMRNNGVNKILFSSTCATYGLPRRLPIDEGHPQEPINPYGRSKLMVEKMIIDYQAAYGINGVILRYFNAAGADPQGELGERHEPETHVIPLAISGSQNGDSSFQIFGSDFDTRDGTAIRDYIHVCDLADAHSRAVDYLFGMPGLEIFNLGTGCGTTVKEIADTVERVVGKTLKREFAPRRLGDPPVLLASAEKALRLLGWNPTHSEIGEIIETAWRWHQKVGRR